ncbi:MAG: hypothetical protein ACLR7Z_20190 [Bilophila wadsworthia]
MGEFGKARAWCLSNPRQRKTKNGIRRFLNGWMDKAQNNASRSSPAAGSGRPMTARQVEAAERGDFAEQVLKLDEVYRNELAALALELSKAFVLYRQPRPAQAEFELLAGLGAMRWLTSDAEFKRGDASDAGRPAVFFRSCRRCAGGRGPEADASREPRSLAGKCVDAR